MEIPAEGEVERKAKEEVVVRLMKGEVKRKAKEEVVARLVEGEVVAMLQRRAVLIFGSSTSKETGKM